MSGHALPAMWVVGAGGLIGSAVVKDSGRRGTSVEVARDVPWGTPNASEVLARKAASFMASVVGAPWGIVWAAGRATPTSSVEACGDETSTVRAFAAALAAGPKPAAGGTFVMVSSAGGVYSGTQSQIITEESSVAPSTHYGRAKLEQEQILADLSGVLGLRFVAARVSNAYGPGQDASKSQGLVTKVCESSLTGQPVVLTTRLDAQRDFVYVDDCAAAIGELMFGSRSAGISGPVIVASSQPSSLGSVIGTIRRLRPARPPLVRTALAADATDDGHFVYASVRLEPAHFATTSLMVGAALTLSSLLRRVQATREVVHTKGQGEHGD